MTNKRSEFGTLLERLAQTDATYAATHPPPTYDVPAKRTRFVMASFRYDGRDVCCPGVLLDWAQEPGGWAARVAVVVDDDGTLVTRWFVAADLIPVPTPD